MAGSDVFTGTLDLLVLRALADGWMHGYAIGRWLRETSAEGLRIEEGALYPALHRLEKRGWIEAEWGETELRRQARFYRLTTGGRRALRSELARWQAHVTAVESVLNARSV
ncbi:MAG: PadR family transcriptional regulator [Gemmatimonadetes bacterium]|nr:PadR family transcriptional regulator [Gemmatimonadota bacterium]